VSARGDFKKFVKQIEKAGGVIEAGRGSHLNVYVDDVLVATISPGGTRGHTGTADATRRHLRRAGLNL
jgi:predicted RNA binding protein YcfA (HicA-like mRNA interferase family)